MTFLRSALLTLALALSPAFAEEMPAAERAAMLARVDAFNADFAAGNFTAIFDYMPPPIIAKLAADAGMTEASLLETSKTQIEKAMATVTIDSYAMDTAAATYRLTPDGRRGFALIPTEVVMSAEGVGTLKATSETLAFADAGKWYLVRIDEPLQVKLLQAAYPEFDGLSFTPGKIEAVE